LIAIEVDARGLEAALRELAKWTSENAGIPVIVECPERFEMPDQTTATHTFRIVQEAVSNALRHAQPRRIRLTVFFEPRGLRLDIKDDGIGLHENAAAKQGLGLRIMKYRAGLIGGALKIDLAEEGGTMVTLTLPHRNGDNVNSTEG
jgi:two-component system, NarL family, sensor histidine kinase DegS